MRLLATVLLAYGVITVAQAFGVHFIANSSTKADNQEKLTEILRENDTESPVHNKKPDSDDDKKESVLATKPVTPLGDGAVEGLPTEQAVTIPITKAITDAISSLRVAETESAVATGTQTAPAGLEQNLKEQATKEAPKILSISLAPLQSDSIIRQTTTSASIDPSSGHSCKSTIEAGTGGSEIYTSQVNSLSVITESRGAVGGTDPTTSPVLSWSEATLLSNAVQSETQTSTHPSGPNNASHETERADQLSTQSKTRTSLSSDKIRTSTAAYTTRYTAGVAGEPGNPLATKPSDSTSQNKAKNQGVETAAGKSTSAHLSTSQGSSYPQASTASSNAKAGTHKSSRGMENTENSSGTSDTTKSTAGTIGEKYQNEVGSKGSSQAQTVQPRVGIDGAQVESGRGSESRPLSARDQNGSQTQGTQSLVGKPTFPPSSAPLNANTRSTSNERLNLSERNARSDASSKGTKSIRFTHLKKDQRASNSEEPSLDDNHLVFSRTHNSSKTGSERNKLAHDYGKPQAFVDETERSVNTKKAGIKTRVLESSASNSSHSRRYVDSTEVARDLVDGKRVSHHSQSAGSFKTDQLSSKFNSLHASNFGPTGSASDSLSNSSLSAHAANHLDQFTQSLLPESEDLEDSDDDIDADDLSDDDDDDDDDDKDEESKKRKVKKVLRKEPNKEKDDDDKIDGAKNPLTEDSDDDEDDEYEMKKKRLRKSHEEDDDDEKEKRTKNKLSSKKTLIKGL